MYPKPLQKLIDLFVKLPGIGPRQATRFAFFLIKESNDISRELAAALLEAKNQTAVCKLCFRAMEKATEAQCVFCLDPKREQTMIAVVEKESDLHNLEKNGVYRGLYHVLGGVISPLDNESPKRLRLKELFERIKNNLESRGKLELILATNPTTEGDTTALYIERIMSPLKNKHPGLIISRLGRGLSLGTEIEYVDETTIKSALENRIKRI